jgi:RNA polymerase sigma-70 factor (ECF subfamily)
MTAAVVVRPSVEAGLDLVRRHQAGDREAFAEIYRTHYPVIFKFALYRVKQRQLAEDLTQDTFTKAFAKISSNFEVRDSAFVAWLITLCRNLIADHFKRSETQRCFPAANITFPASREESFPERDPAPPADLQVLAALASADLASAVLDLNDQQQTVIILRYFRGLSVAETAAEMGLNEGAVKAAGYRAVRGLARRLDLEQWL